MNFHETKRGQIFFDSQLPKLISTLTDISATLKAPTPVYQMEHTVPEYFLADLYHGAFDPSDLPNPSKTVELTPEIITVQTRLREVVTADAWTLIERYRTLLDSCHIAEREQAFAAGFHAATTMFAAGLATPPCKEVA